MFLSLSIPDQEINARRVSFITYSDGFDAGCDPSIHENADRMRKELTISPKLLSAITDRLAERGQHVTCIIRTPFLPCVVDVALAYGVPSILYWVSQPRLLNLVIYYQ